MRTALVKKVDDWSTYLSAAELTSALIQWTSTQETPIMSEVVRSTAKFRQNQVCARLTLKDASEPALDHWLRYDIPSDKMSAIPQRGEATLRKEVAKTVAQGAERLATIRAAIVESRAELGRLKRPYLESFRTQLLALIKRIDSLAGRNEMLELEIQTVHEGLAKLAPGSAGWNDEKYLRGLMADFKCVRPNQYTIVYRPPRPKTPSVSSTVADTKEEN